ncbi:Helix-turn-helix domain-containing protein [Clostridium cavendishii DSM 21758]|uniref:Helix-turn-helix domain-containing protein n=1 Tax=Clostridium cavendishii DSM 21758 TaxID=1121302 RepID=A0A1M6PJG0_9CLOT|nr:S24 family peptidase [Clostridium cavendishii]SHK08076.1 Helix-turn-helix domain-containing protein [Clostridium cavendishii DSM 21758]
MSRVGEKIKEARLKNGMSQKVLAKKLGVAEKFINEVELGRRILNESLIERIGKTLNTDLNDVSMVVTDEDLNREKALFNETRANQSKASKKADTEVNEVWNQAFGSVLKNVPIYDYTLTKVQGSRQLPVHSNKIEGHASDKVFYLVVENDDMSGYRVAAGDIAFCHAIKEVENNAICLLDYNGKRAIRQVKKLDNTKVLLISNRGSVMTETVEIKKIQPVAKLDKVEIQL